jgi:tetratricopeptide (TPR) repeat protein
MIPAGCNSAKPQQKKTLGLTITSEDSPAAPEKKLKPLPAKATLTLEQLEPKLTQPVDKTYDRQLPPGGQKALEEGRELRNKGNLAKAIDKFERAKGFDPNNPLIAKQLGLTYAKLQSYGKAVENLNIAAEYFGNDADMQVLLGHMAVLAKKPAQAQRRFRLALLCSNAKPENKNAARALLRLGELLESQGYWTAALECFTKLEKWIRQQSAIYQDDEILEKIVMNPEKLIAVRGRLLAMLRRNDEAVKVLRRAYRRNRSDSTTAQLLVGALVASDKYDQAEKLLVELAGQTVHGTIVPILARRLCLKSGDKTMPGRIAKAYRAKNAVSAEMALSLARAAMFLKAPKEAGEILQDLLREMPDNTQAVAMLAAISARQGKYDQALRLLAELVEKNSQTPDAVRAGVKEILSADPAPPAELLNTFSKATYKETGKNKFALHYVAGILAEQSGKELLAADHFKRAIEEKKDFHPAYEALLSLQLQAGGDDEVNEILEGIKAQAKQGYYYYYLLGKTRLQQGKISEAIIAFKKAYEENPSHLQTVLELARAYRQAATKRKLSSQGRVFFRRAQKMYKKALELDPKQVATYREAFDLSVQWRDLKTAKEIAQSLRSQLPKSPDGFILAAELYIIERNYGQAGILLMQLAKQFPGRVEIPLLAIRGDLSQYPGVLPKVVYENSVKMLDAIIKKFPNNLQALRMLAGLYSRPVPGEFAKAVEVWRKLYEQFPRDQVFVRTYVASLMRAKQYAPAREILVKLLDKKPGDSNIRRMLLDVLVQLGRIDEAINLTRKWWEKSPKTLKGQSGFEWLGLLLNLYEKDGQYDEAIKLLDELLKGKSDISTQALQGQKMGLLVKDGRYDEAASFALESKTGFPVQKLAYDNILEKKYGRALKLLDKRIEIVQIKISAEKIKRQQAEPSKPTTTSQPATSQPAALTQPARTQPVATTMPVQQKTAARKNQKKSKAEQEYETELAILKQLKVMAQIQANPSDLKPVLEWMNEQLKKNPAAKDPRQLLISGLMEIKKFGQALEFVDEWIKELSETKPRPRGADPTLLWCREMAISLLIAEGKAAEALTRSKKNIAIEPNRAEFYNLQATALGELGKTAESLKALRRAHALKPKDPSLCNNLAYSLADAGVDLPFAEKLIQSCFKQLGSNLRVPSAFLDTKGWVLYKQGRFSQAGGIFLRILPEEPGDASAPQDPSAADHPVLWDHAGDVFYRLGWKDRALFYWKMSLAKAKKEKKITREVQVLLENVPKKIVDAEADRKVHVAPLSKKNEKITKDLKNKVKTQVQKQPKKQLKTPTTQESK